MTVLKSIYNAKPIRIKPLVSSLHYNAETRAMDEQAYNFVLYNDNYVNCPAHEKTLDANEMLAIYEYMKKIVEKN